jgi:dCTP deaminase
VSSAPLAPARRALLAGGADRRPRAGGGMTIKSDKWIREKALGYNMIKPFTEKQISKGKISYGLSSYGYDIRVGHDFKVFTNVRTAIVDPKNFDPRSFIDYRGDVCIIPPNSFALAASVEYMKIPRDVLCICVGKSTYARCGIITNVTPLEPGWEGHITLEISNTTTLPAKIYAGEGLVQVLFFQSDEPCEVTYADRGGKYQGQQGVTIPKVN